MSLKTSWSLRCAALLLTAQVVSACTGGGEPNPPPGQDTTAPTTRATPAGGSFSALVAVALACDDGAGSGCAATYFTVDGSEPGTSSPQYREPFTLAANTTVRFFSVDKAGNTEGAKSEQYTFTSGQDTQAPTTVANPAGGSFNSPRSVALTCDDGTGTGCAATYFTLDGSIPSESSTRYTAALAISATTTLRFFSVDRAGNAEGVRRERYVLDTEPPTVAASPRGGTYGATRVVTLTCDDGDGAGCAAIHYTLDGSIPSASSPVYTAPFTLQATTRVRFLAVDLAGNASDAVTELYTLDGTGPVTTATPRGGTFHAAFTVSLACDDGTGTGCAATYFTTNGAAPTRSSERFAGPITISGNTTLRFFSVDAADNDGPVVTETYVLDQAAPVTRATPPGRSYAGEQLVTLTCEDAAGTGCVATYYTLDGSAPTTTSPLYVAPVRVASSLTLRFFSVDQAGNVETPRTEPYVIDRVPPTAAATPPGGTYATVQQVTLTCADGTGSGCASIHYTLDGSTPTVGSAAYQAPLQLASNVTLRFFAVDAVGNRGEVQTQQYSIDTSAPLTTASPAGGTFGGDTQVTLTCDDGQGGTGCAVTRYTDDGTAPTDTSPRYTGPIAVTSTRTLRFFSVDTAGNREPTRVATFTVDRVAPTTTPSLRGGNYTTPVTVSLSCLDAGGSTCAATHLTLDGSTPTTASPRYTGPITFQANTTTTLRFFSVDALGNAEAVKTESFLVDTAPPLTTAAPRGGTYRAAQDVVLTCNDGAGVGCGAVFHTTDPAAPKGSFFLYSGPIRVSANTTLRFYSEDALGNSEPVRSETYVIDTVAPTVSASPRGGAYPNGQQVTFTCGDAGSGCAAIHYTTNGGTPDTSSPRYEGLLFINTNTTLRFIAVDAAGNSSAVVTETYTFTNDITPPVTTASPPGGAFTGAFTVALSCADNVGGTGCAGSYYTLDGTAPTTGSTRYTGAITISSNTTLRFRSADAAGNLEAAKTETYTLDTTRPQTVATPAGGSYQGPVTVTLSCSDTGSGCRETRYTTDGSPVNGASPLYTAPLTLTQTTTLRFFSVDQAGNMETPRVEQYELPAGNASAQIAAVRSTVDGPASLPVEGAIITYVKPGVGNLTNDPAGFFLQAERTGPALFVEVDPTQLFPPPQAGMRVNVIVSSKWISGGMVRTNISSYSVQSSGFPLSTFIQDVSNVDLPSVVWGYEAELITLNGTVTGAFFSAGTGHSQASLATAGVPEGSTSAISFRLRMVETVREQLDVTQGCTVSIVSPLWVFVNLTSMATQPSVWEASQVTSLTCPGPKVTSAQATGQGTVAVRFDRKLDPASILASGSQFSIPGLPVTGATLINSREVWVSTGAQVPRQAYTVTVAATVRDTRGIGVSSMGNASTFRGWVTPAVLRITEVAPGVTFGRDLVEFFVLQGGTTEGMTLVDLSTSSTPLATLPDVTVATGDLIVMHLNPDRTPGVDAPASETFSKTEFPQFTYASNYDSAWDFQGGTSGVSQGNRVLRIRDSLGNTQDALAAVATGNVTAAYLPFLQGLQAEGLWLPSDCAGALCTYSTFPSAHDVSFNWTGAFPSGGRTTTVGRIIAGDSNQASDWAVGPGTLGVLNP
ncbi:chitobiase/beta-hexosaminidase C-terminal domain-containing protein [Pyxidicoccus xibeiensis]|uniref:chitobiase/beta-hexosaminidase C-terminal domain-containing protein n=1 Tax=Pyxidicoccus xibeiensis TaxID=2906759 RepID=UPI0020A739B6|nr:chitobiase/beta-hexosaminidase C-terminal domain-containing protein [Pyxidicoccus xibeiensis]MCP3145223.1 chitobiase/beta-hexosaminidase C-terminal domain-containing protein [Pyxidicoccus xibeiensis]